MRQAGVLDLVVGARYLDTAAIDETVVCQDNNFVVRAAGTIEAELVESVEVWRVPHRMDHFVVCNVEGV
jgi:hypothetical protein